tara:strand:+ start:187 stop:660 length:474 start_codon:yes stop_codon:yes gene_type:complete
MCSIANFSNYLIYNSGEIYSIRNKKFLKKRYDRYGYPRVGIRSDDKKPYTFHIHKLVALAYLAFTPAPNLTIDHIDHNKTNNYLHNLQICTRAQNTMRNKCIKKNGLPKGVFCWGSKYKSFISINCKRMDLGLYNTSEEAGLAYKIEFDKIMENVIL